MEKFGEQLRAYRKQKGWNQSELAEKLKISLAYVSKLEKGQSEPNFHLKQKILELMGSEKRPAPAPEEGFIRVPRYEIEASAGNGAIVASEQIVDYLSFREDWLTTSLGVSPDRLALITVIGDSMSPSYNDGDLILVDIANGRPKSDAVYVLQHEGFLWVKRLNFRLDGSIHVISDNPRYPEQVISGEALDRLKIVGRVMWRGGR